MYIPMFRRTCRTMLSSASDHSSLSRLLSNLCQKGWELAQPFFSAPCFSCKSPEFFGTLGRTRPRDLLLRSHSPSQTGRDTGGHGETKQRFYQVIALLEGQGGTGGDTRLRSDCGQNLRLSRRVLEPEGAESLPEGIFSAAR